MRGLTATSLRRGAMLGAIASSVALVIVLIALLVSMVLGYRVLVVRSGSMQPSLEAGDVILTRATRPTTVATGDVITFRDGSRADRLVTHRVVQAVPRDGYVEFETRGDANTGSEHWSIHTGGTVGALSFRLTGIAAAGGLVLDPRMRVVVILLSGAATAFLALRAVWAR